MKFFTFLLVISLINLSVTNGQETACRKWKEAESTDMAYIFGHWFTYLEDKYFVKEHDVCSEYSVYWNSSSKSMDLINKLHYDDNTTKSIKGKAQKTQILGVIEIDYENSSIFELSAIEMDDNYGLFGACLNGRGIFI